MTADNQTGMHRGRYNMDFDPEKGDPYGNLQKALSHIDALKQREQESPLRAGKKEKQ